VLSACSANIPCASSSAANKDLGGWMVDEASTMGVHQYCAGRDHRFVLQAVAERKADGGVIRWTKLTDLNVHLHRGERLMFGFECGSALGIRGDVIAVVNTRTDEPLRTWHINVTERRFVLVSPETVTCESIE
jgi:hypothetical protein